MKIPKPATTLIRALFALKFYIFSKEFERISNYPLKF